MKRPTSTFKLLTAVLMVAVLAVSCGKEEIAPCSQHSTETTDGPTKTRPVSNQGAGDRGGDNGAVISKPTNTGTGISDDGDDLSDSERSRKKSRN